MAALARYDAMIVAIAECARVDEAKDIRDKAAALEAYYRQARNLDAEREATNVRLRAERRAGELLKELARADTPNPKGIGGKSGKVDTSNDGTHQSPYAAALESNGMSRQTAHRFQALANVPQEDFERVLSASEKPSTIRVLRTAAAAVEPKVSDESLWLWGRLRDFERDGYLEKSPADLLDGMTDAMRSDCARLAPLVADFLHQVERAHELA